MMSSGRTVEPLLRDTSVLRTSRLIRTLGQVPIHYMPCVDVCVCVDACVCVCVWMRVCVCVCGCVCDRSGMLSGRD